MLGSSGSAVPITSPSHPNLLAFYSMDDVSGSTLNDGSPNGYSSTITGASFVAGRDLNAISFSGAANQYTNRSSAEFLTSAGSVSFFATAGTASQSNRVIGIVNAGVNNQFYMISILSTGKVLVFGLGGSIGSYVEVVSDTAPATPSAYNHFVVQADASSLEIFVNGVLSTITVNSGALSSLYGWFSQVPTASSLEMGAIRQASSLWGDGEVDHLKSFNRKLTLSEVGQLGAEI